MKDIFQKVCVAMILAMLSVGPNVAAAEEEGDATDTPVI